MPNDKALYRTQQDIQQMFRAIKTATRRDKTPATPTPAETTAMAHNTFAQDVFFKNTNILQIAAKEKIGRSEERVKHHAIRLYERYVNDRAQRIRAPFHQLRFSSQKAEGLFRMALNVPIESAEQMEAHRRMLALHGIRHECFVDITQNNIVLEDQAAVVAKLQRAFTNWSAKLTKLPKYLQPRIEKRAMAKRNALLEQLRYHSNFSDLWEGVNNYENQMLEDLKHPSEQRVLRLWRNFQFDDDELNRRYKLGIHRPRRSLSRSCSSEDVAGPSRTQEDDHDPVYHDAMQPETCCSPARSDLAETVPDDNMLATPQDYGAKGNSAERVLAAPSAAEEAPRTGSPPVPYTLEDIKQKTNVHELMKNMYSSAYNITKTWTHSQMERVIRRYYKSNRDTFRAGRLPDSLRLLSKEEQEALQNASICTAPQQDADASTSTRETQKISSAQSATEPMPSRVEEPCTSSPTTTTKRTTTNLVQSRKRPIVYDSITDSETESPVLHQNSKRPAVYLEDSTTGLSEYIGLGSPAPTPISDTMNIQSSLRFEPSICSTQNVADEELAHATPHCDAVSLNEAELQERNPSPNTSLSVTYTDANTSLSVTVRHMDEQRAESPETLNLVSPETPTSIKQEPEIQSNRRNYSGYEGFVEVVPLESPEIIVLDDSIPLTDDEQITYEPPETVSQPRTSPTSPTMSRINEIFRLPEQDDGLTVSEIGTPEGVVEVID
ncbi:uncharacterized protein LOC126581192 isoform X2 [Anopheles aquasalis]|uniref:uncharacterized protein LOC126581192 isoform X2 n=1 Tax=Anopheles aquasalis TaxID=42839 RepID=UPI00215AEB81|nr:uncharacterized protein LOC126581192 isoform X2 [Anopheles aquasalis]